MLILEPAVPFIYRFLFLSFAQDGDKHLKSPSWHPSTKAAQLWREVTSLANFRVLNTPIEQPIKLEETIVFQ